MAPGLSGQLEQAGRLPNVTTYMLFPRRQIGILSRHSRIKWALVDFIMNILIASSVMADPLTPLVGVTPSELDFGLVEIGAEGTLEAEIINASGDTASILDVTGIEVVGLGFTLLSGPTLPVFISGTGSVGITIGFTPSVNGPAYGELRIISPSATNSPYSGSLAGSGVNQPGGPESPADSSETFSSGLFVAFGNVIRPPITLSVSGDTLLLNDYQLAPALQQHLPPEIPLNPRTLETNAIFSRVSGRALRMLESGQPLSQVMDYVMRSLEGASQYIQRVERSAADGVTVYVTNPNVPSGVMPIQMLIRPREPHAPSISSYANSAYREFGGMLRAGGVVLYKRPGRATTIPPRYLQQVLDCIDGLREHGVPYGSGEECSNLLLGFEEDILNPRQTSGASR